jgi:hypothetical protein
MAWNPPSTSPGEALEGQTIPSAETLIEAAATLAFFFPRRAYVAGKTVAALLVPLSIEELTAYNAISKTSGLENKVDSAVEAVNRLPPNHKPDPLFDKYPTLGSIAIDKLLSPLPDLDPFVRQQLDILGADRSAEAAEIIRQRQAQQATQGPRIASRERRPLSPADVERLRPDQVAVLADKIRATGIAVDRLPDLSRRVLARDAETKRRIMQLIMGAATNAISAINSMSAGKGDP